MMNAFSVPQNLLVFGGTSDIAVAAVRHYVTRGTERVTLAGRSPDALQSVADELTALGAEVTLLPYDAESPTSAAEAAAAVKKAGSFGDVDLVLWAVGQLGDQAGDLTAPEAISARVAANFTAGAEAITLASQAMTAQGHGVIVVLSSVAGERARASNFVYGSTKAGLDAFAQGLGAEVERDGVHVLVVRPGFVHSKMTQALDPAPLATTPERVALDIAKGVQARKPVIWSPAPLRLVMFVLRHLPTKVFRRLPI